MPGNQRKRSGFTLIELMIVVSIIGIMAAICIPNYLRFQCRAKQSEAKEVLKAIWLVEEAYMNEEGLYVLMPDLTTYAGLSANTLLSKYYAFTVTIVGGMNAYTVTAADTIAAVAPSSVPDEWFLTEEDSRPVNVSDRCAQ